MEPRLKTELHGQITTHIITHLDKSERQKSRVKQFRLHQQFVFANIKRAQSSLTTATHSSSTASRHS